LKNPFSFGIASFHKYSDILAIDNTCAGVGITIYLEEITLVCTNECRSV
jgi:hypothetical protein